MVHALTQYPCAQTSGAAQSLLYTHWAITTRWLPPPQPAAASIAESASSRKAIAGWDGMT